MKFFNRLRNTTKSEEVKEEPRIDMKECILTDQDITESRQNKFLDVPPLQEIGAGASGKSARQSTQKTEQNELNKFKTQPDKSLVKTADNEGNHAHNSEQERRAVNGQSQLESRGEEVAKITKEKKVSQQSTAHENGQPLLQKQSLRQTTEELIKLRKELESLRQLVGVHQNDSRNFAAQMLSQAQIFQAEHNAMIEKLTKYEQIRQQNRELYNQIQDMRGHIRVICRVRPTGFAENELAVISTEGQYGLDQVEVLDKNKQWKSFTFDRVLGPETTQAQIYGELAPLTRSALDGFSVCIFAYGQTSSGKTYTMSGPSDTPKTDANKGLQYRVLDDLFQLANERQAETQYFMSVQMLEIYNDNLRDLLNPNPSNTAKSSDIRLVDGVVNTRKVEVRCTDDVVKVIAEGERIRAVGSTALNELSSRSHQVVTIVIEGTDTLTGEGTRAKLQLVDLAGSERVAISQAEGDRLKEAQYINKSLSALGDVVSSLQNKNQHIPYRNSRLTQVLQDSMTGSGKMVMLMHVNPEMNSQQESLSTLSFGVRAAAVERAAPVKMSLSVPLNTSQMKQVMEDLENKTKELEAQSSEMEQVKQSSDSSARVLQMKNKEVRELAGALASSRAEVAVLEAKVAKLKREQAERARESNAAGSGSTAAGSGGGVSSSPTSARVSFDRSGPPAPARAISPTPTRKPGDRLSLPVSSRNTGSWDNSMKTRTSLGGNAKESPASRVPAAPRTPMPSLMKPKPTPQPRPKRPQSAPPSTNRPKPTASRTASVATSNSSSISSSRKLGSTESLTGGVSQSKFKSRSKPTSALSSQNTSPRVHSPAPPRVSHRRTNSEQFNRLTKSKVTKVDARFADRDAYGLLQTSKAAEYSAEAAAAAEEVAAEQRREQEEASRKLRLKRMAQERPEKAESKYKDITNFDKLLEEAESQLARLAGSSTQMEGEVKDGNAEDVVSAIAEKITKVELEAQSSGATDGKNEKERQRIIQRANQLIGQLESDDIVSTNMESRLEKSRQIKRCKQLIASLEMAAMTTCWSTSNAWN